jgi:hypothetical protein
MHSDDVLNAHRERMMRTFKTATQVAVIGWASLFAIVGSATAASIQANSIQTCFEGCNSMFREESRQCGFAGTGSQTKENCANCNGIWDSFAGGCHAPEGEFYLFVSECLSRVCRERAQNNYRACAAKCVQQRQEPVTGFSDDNQEL